MTVNWTVRRRDTIRYINEDPWDVTIYREGATPDDAEVTFTFVGRIAPLGAWQASRGYMTGAQRGEIPLGSYAWVGLAPYTAPTLLARDSFDAVQRETGITRRFRIAFSTRYAYKQEAVLDERQ